MYEDLGHKIRVAQCVYLHEPKSEATRFEGWPGY